MKTARNRIPFFNVSRPVLDVGSAWRFSGDGTLSFNPLLRPIQLPWSISLSVRTLQQNALIMCVLIGQDGYSLITVC